MRKYVVLLTIVLLISSCEEFLEQEPVDIITTETVIEDGPSAVAALLGVYSRLQTAGLYGNRMVSIPGVASDELTHSGSFPSVADFDNHSLTAANPEVEGIWEAIYTGIYQANNILEVLTGRTFPRLSDNEQKQILAEARALRAFLHMEATKLWGDVPWATTTNLEALKSISRTSRSEIFSFVISELQSSVTELTDVTESTTVGPFRLTQWGVKGLLARAHLYAGDLTSAGQVANDVIVNGGFSLETDFRNAFLTGSREAIFTIFFSNQDQNGLPFQFLPAGRFEYAVSPQLITAFGSVDRRALIVANDGDAQGRFAVNKYPDLLNRASLVPIVRLPEMYLIRAEANLGTAQALSDINILRARAGVDLKTDPITINDVLAERFVELAFEGHRWNDLIRTNTIDNVMGAINPGTWNPNVDKLFPLPFFDLNLNANLQPQNPGY
jgi:starch-binding outer membrane protein, SusD/RagB family